MIGKTIAQIAPGDRAELRRVVQEGYVAAFIAAVGDRNPLHSDARFAATTPFKGTIAPGIFTAGLISAVIGTRLPGPGVIYLSQSLTFSRPVRVGDTITARVEVVEVLAERNRMRLATVCANQRGEDVLSGEAWVMPARTPTVYDPPPALATALAALAWQPWAWAAQAATVWGTLSLSLLAAGRPAPAPSTARR